MWTIYDIYSDQYWNEQARCWCTVEQATRYTVEQRNQLRLSSVTHQWRFIEPPVPAAAPLASLTPC